MYLYLNSKPSSLYPENRPSDFEVQLPRAIVGTSLGVIEISLSFQPEETLFLCADICEASIVNTRTLPVLRQVVRKTSTPIHVSYIPLRWPHFDSLRLYLCRESGEVAELAGGITEVTLHLQ